MLAEKTMTDRLIIEKFMNHLSQKDFPCVGARASIQKGQGRYLIAGHMGCPKDDMAILNFLYRFIEEYRNGPPGYFSASVIFRQPVAMSEEEFDRLLWQRLGSLREIDQRKYHHDPRVSDDPASVKYAFSLMEEAFFIIGMHAGSSRASRRFDCPVLVFNPHAQFEQLRANKTFDKMQHIIRRRDTFYSGSVNPMLMNYSEGLAVRQYSGRNYDKHWQCPLKRNRPE